MASVELRWNYVSLMIKKGTAWMFWKVALIGSNVVQ